MMRTTAESMRIVVQMALDYCVMKGCEPTKEQADAIAKVERTLDIIEKDNARDGL